MENILKFARLYRAFSWALVALVIGWLAPAAMVQANQFASADTRDEPILHQTAAGLTLTPNIIGPVITPIVSSATLSGVSISCPATVTYAGNGPCNATASYSNGTSKAVTSVSGWSTTNPSVLSFQIDSISKQMTTSAQKITVADTPVTVNFSYTENGVTKTASTMVTVKIYIPTPTGITLSCPSTIASNTQVNCTTTVSYSDGTSKIIKNGNYYPDNAPVYSTDKNVAYLLINASGTELHALNVTADTKVTVTVGYFSGNTSLFADAVVTVKAPGGVFTSLTVNCPTALYGGISISCPATAFNSDGTSKTVTPTFSSSDPLVSANGTSMTFGNVATNTVVAFTASYTENGVTLTATGKLTIEPSPTSITTLSVGCPSTVAPGAPTPGMPHECHASVMYANMTTNAVSPTWQASDPNLIQFTSGGNFNVGSVSTDTPVTVTGSYTENGLTVTKTVTITVKAVAKTLAGVTLSCPATVNAGDSVSCTGTATYGDGSTMPVPSYGPLVSWESSGPAAAMAGSTLIAQPVTADATVTITLSYTENGVAKTATASVTVKPTGQTANACSGTAKNLGAITIAGSATKKLGVDPIDVSYCLKNFEAFNFDLYVAILLPDHSLLWMQSQGIFGTPTFSATKTPYVPSSLIKDQSGQIMSLPTLPATLPVGTYTFYAIPVIAGADVMNGFNWMGVLAKAQVILIQ